MILIPTRLRRGSKQYSLLKVPIKRVDKLFTHNKTVTSFIIEQIP